MFYYFFVASTKQKLRFILPGFFLFSIIGVVIDCQFIFIFIDLPALLLLRVFYCISLTVLRCNLETGAYGEKKT